MSKTRLKKVPVYMIYYCGNGRCFPFHKGVMYACDDVTVLVLRRCPCVDVMVNHLGWTHIEWAQDQNRPQEIISTLESPIRIDEVRSK